MAGRAQCATNGTDMAGMRRTLLHFLELSDCLDEQAVPATI